MHQLPFGAQMTDTLFRVVEQADKESSFYARGYIPSFSEFGAMGRVLSWTSRAQAQPGRIFAVDGLEVCVSHDEEVQFRGRVLDWAEGTGVVLRDPWGT